MIDPAGLPFQSARQRDRMRNIAAVIGRPLGLPVELEDLENIQP